MKIDKKFLKLSLIAILLIFGVYFFTNNLMMGSLLNGENETYYREITINDTTLGTDTIIQLDNRIVETGMETDFSNVEFYDTTGTLLLQDFESSSVKIQLNTTDTSTTIYERWGTDISAINSDLNIQSKDYWIDTNISNVYIPYNIPTGTTTLYLKKTGGHTPKAFDIQDTNLLYFEGTEQTAWVEGYTNVYGSQSKNADHLYLAVVAIDNSKNERTYVTDTMFDLTGIDTLYVDWEAADNPYNMLFTAGTVKTSDRARYDPTQLKFGRPSEFARRIDSLNVSDVNEQRYIKVAVEGATFDGLGASVIKVYGVSMLSATIPDSITDTGDYYEITINNAGSELTNYNIQLNTTEIGVTLSDESLEITENLLTSSTYSTGTTNYIINSQSESVTYGNNATIEKSFDSEYRHEWYLNNNISKNETVQNASFEFTPNLGINNVILYTYNDLDWLMESNEWTITCTEATVPSIPSSSGGGGSTYIPPVVEEIIENDTELINTTISEQLDKDEVFDLLNDNTQAQMIVVLFVLIAIVVFMFYRGRSK